MKKKEWFKRKVVVFSILFLLFLVVVFVCVSSQKEKTLQVEAVVEEVLTGNILVKDDEGMEYRLVTEEEYNVGDKVSFVLKNCKVKDEITEGELIRLKTIQKSVQFTIMDDGNSEEETVSEDVAVNNTSEKEVDALTYFMNLENEVKNTTNTEEISSSIKNGLVTIVDFLFYEKQIAGKKFSELSDATKLQILKIAYSIDDRLEDKFPNYKEKISSTSGEAYTELKTKILITYLDLSEKVCTNHQDTCELAKEGLGELRENFSLTWTFIKDIAGEGVEKLKTWYEIWRDSE